MAKLITVVSATGGCGKTFFATNLAGISAVNGVRVLLVDLDLQFGEVAVALQLKPQYSIIDGFYRNDGTPLLNGSLAEHFEELLAHHPSGFDVLAAPRDPAEADLITEDDVGRLLEEAGSRYDLIVVDTPPALTEVVMKVLDHSDSIAVLTSLDVPSLKNLSVYLDTLSRIGIDESRVHLVLNKIERDVGIDENQAQDIFDNRFVGLIAHDRVVQRSLNLGRLLFDEAPRARVTKQLRQGVLATLNGGAA